MTARTTITLIAALAENGVIGRDGGLPWRLPADLRHFKRHTLGKPVIMGRRTQEEVGRPLPRRTNIVVSATLTRAPEGFTLARSPDEALRLAGPVPEIMIIGGAGIYAAFLDRADRLLLTEVHARVDGDTHFPPLDRALWREASREAHPADAEHAHAYSFVHLERIAPVPPVG